MIRALALLLLIASPAFALELQLPATARLTAERDTDPDIYAAPIGVFQDNAVKQLVLEGPVRRAAWRLDASGLTPLQVMRPLQKQLEAAGFSIALDCAALECGGFDFRFATETLPGPNMYVNIRAYHFVTGIRKVGDVPQEVVTILASTSASSAYVQIIQAGEVTQGAVKVAAVDEVSLGRQSFVVGDLPNALLGKGHVVLSDLEFKTGSSDLGEGPFETLDRLAAFLKGRPDLRVAMVGHTDSVGGLAANIALSKRRAQSVRRKLIDAYGLSGGRIDAEGMGYLSPIESNLTPAGREGNRRVEAILLSSDKASD